MPWPTGSRCWDNHWPAGQKQDRAIASSLNFGAYRRSSGDQVGYARVVTDLATFGWLCDVYIAPAARRQGLGTALAAATRDHLARYGLRRILLARTGSSRPVRRAASSRSALF